MLMWIIKHFNKAWTLNYQALYSERNFVADKKLMNHETIMHRDTIASVSAWYENERTTL